MNFKKILIGVILFFVVLNIANYLVTLDRKRRLERQIAKGSIVNRSQVVIKMAEERNVRWFENQDELNQGYDDMDILGNSYIHEAVRFKRYELVKYFVSKGKKFNFQNKEGLFPIDIAAKTCDVEMLKILEPLTPVAKLNANGETWRMYLQNCKVH